MFGVLIEEWIEENQYYEGLDTINKIHFLYILTKGEFKFEFSLSFRLR